VSAEDSIVQPERGGNCTNWIVGHLVRAQNGVMGLLDEAPVWESTQLERAHDTPIESPDQAIDWDVMVQKLLGSEERLMTAFEALDDERLDDQGFTDPFGNEVTRGEFLSILAFHQTYHAGQLGLSRRIAGLPGVIGAPQPQEA
jgi:uncharacterized damage-inducible protein DinB